MNGSMFGGMPPQGMFGQQAPAQSMFGGQGLDPQMMQLIQQLMMSGAQQPTQQQRGMLPGPAFPEQYNATPGSVPGTSDQNIRITPEMIRALFGPQTFGI